MKNNIFCVALCAMLFALCSPAQAQQSKRVSRIGFLAAGSSSRVDSFREALREIGYTDGKNIAIEVRDTAGKTGILSSIATELVGLKVDVIVTLGTAPTQAAKDTTSSIPIVMTNVSDPVGSGFVRSLARPGGNITGMTNFGPELSGKRLELLREILPKTSRVAILLNRGAPIQGFLVREMRAPAMALGITLLPLELRDVSADQIEEAFRSLKKDHSHALMVLLPFSNRLISKRLVELALKHRLPTTYHWQEYVEAGGLMYYGPNVNDMYRRAAIFVDKILKGAKPADLPVEQPKKFEFIINLKTAKQIGLTIPPNVLARADKVIR